MQAPDFVQSLVETLDRRSIAMPRVVAESIVSHVCGVPRSDLDFYSELNEDEMMRAENLLERVLKGEPFEYAIGKVDFYGNQLMLSRCALIPRSETELMLDFAVKKLKALNRNSGVAIDLCSGCGCIGLGFKRAMPDYEVNLIDIDPHCVELARDNARHLELNVRVLEGDFLEPLKAIGGDVVFCNPPYISEAEFEGLDKSVKDFEPKLALTAPDEGLYFYKKMAAEMAPYLNPEALLFIEFGSSQQKALEAIFENSPFKVVSFEKDLAGHDRFLVLELE